MATKIFPTFRSSEAFNLLQNAPLVLVVGGAMGFEADQAETWTNDLNWQFEELVKHSWTLDLPTSNAICVALCNTDVSLDLSQIEQNFVAPKIINRPLPQPIRFPLIAERIKAAAVIGFDEATPADFVHFARGVCRVEHLLYAKRAYGAHKGYKLICPGMAATAAMYGEDHTLPLPGFDGQPPATADTHGS